jgi:hypothetical protein
LTPHEAGQAERAPHPITGQPFASPVPPGTGWPDDPAGPDTEVAKNAADVLRLSADADLAQVSARISPPDFDQ